MPRTVGYIDGTLIKIVPPPKADNQQIYRSRKGYTALNVQIVCILCNANLYIMHVNARFPGSTNDSYIYRASPVLPVMTNAYQQDPCWLLGDSGYPLQPWLMLPLPHAERGTPEFHYTKLHCHARNCVERCIGVLKARWRCLLSDRTMHYKPEKCERIVNACVVLHNYLTQLRAPEPGPILEQLGNDPAEEVFEEDWGLLQEANEVRRHLIQHAHARWLRLHEND